MTIEELLSQITELQQQLKSLNEGVEYRGENEIPNYYNLVDAAEGAFLKKEYLEAFLIQSCIIEGVLKKYASKKLANIFSKSQTLDGKFKNFELARIVDELFITGKIKEDLYGSLDIYRKKRNKIIHDLLAFEDKIKLDTELKQAYLSGKHMKGLIVEDMSKEVEDKSIEFNAQIHNLLSQIAELQSELAKLHNKK